MLSCVSSAQSSSLSSRLQLQTPEEEDPAQPPPDYGTVVTTTDFVAYWHKEGLLVRMSLALEDVKLDEIFYAKMQEKRI